MPCLHATSISKVPLSCYSSLLSSFSTSYYPQPAPAKTQRRSRTTPAKRSDNNDPFWTLPPALDDHQDLDEIMAERMKAQRQEARPKPRPRTPDYARTVSDILFYSAVFFKYMHTSVCSDFLHDPNHEGTASTYAMIALDSLLFGVLLAWLPGRKYQREWAAFPLEAMLSFLMALAFGSAFVWPVVWGALLRILEH